MQRAVRAIIATFASALPGIALGAEATRLELSFHIFTGGYHAVTMAANLDLGPERYRLETRTSTNGIADVIFRFTQTARVEGALTASGPRPLRFESASDGRWNFRLIEMAYGAEGPELRKLEPPVEADERDEVPLHLRQATLDPLTAAISAILREPDRPCTGSAPVFDGRRRYDLHFEAVGYDSLKADQPDGFGGEALRCRIVFEPIAGFMKQYEDRTREARPPTELWLARIAGARQWLPVRMVSHSGLGRATGHLVSASVDDRPVLLTRAASR
ncbi:MAG: DUF3108 domain-containing protein [Alphaproteobacteria bacterium]|nr:DUF3108 domain-containing protein [Alphaproteobacteria bacterium]